MSSLPLVKDDDDQCTLSKAWQAQAELWKVEQRLIASSVRVLPSSQPVVADHGKERPLFHVLKREDYTDEMETDMNIDPIDSSSNDHHLFGGVDVSFPENETDDAQAVAVYVIIDRRTMKIVHHDYEYFHLTVPYMPSFLAFREITPLELLIKRQPPTIPKPRAILVDGNGIFHPRHAGIASVLGVRTNIPTIGVGKTLYYQDGWTRENLARNLDHFLYRLYRHFRGKRDDNNKGMSKKIQGVIMKMDPPHANDDGIDDGDGDDGPPPERFEILQYLAQLCSGGIGMELLSEEKTSRFPVLACALVGHGTGVGTRNPIFISVGHDISLQEAVSICASLSNARIPEPVRQADLLGRNLLRKRAREE